MHMQGSSAARASTQGSTVTARSTRNSSVTVEDIDEDEVIKIAASIPSDEDGTSSDDGGDGWVDDAAEQTTEQDLGYIFYGL